MLNIGRKTYRNLPEQVGFLTKEVEKIWESLDGLDVYDNVIILDALNPLTPSQLEIVDKPVSFIVYNNTLYMKRGVGVDEVYFDAVFQVSESSGVISFVSSEITVSYPLGTLTEVNTSTNTYDKDTLDTALATKLNVSDLLNAVYPVGSIYMSVGNTSPALLFGGTWQQLKDSFLLGAGDVYNNGDTGGNANHKHALTDGYAKWIYSWIAGVRNGMIFKQKSVPNYSTDIITTENMSSYASGASASNLGLELGGDTTTTSNMPPYLVVNMWKRIA